MRQEVGTLRRALAAHRSSLVALTHPELEALANNASSERFQSLFRRYEATLQEALTLTSVILLPGALLAGVMGMNFKVGLFENACLFWVVVAVILTVAPVSPREAAALDLIGGSC